MTNVKYSLQQVKEVIEKAGCKLLTEEYNGCKVKLHIQCECGNEMRVRYDHFRNGNRCKDCVKRKREATCLKIYGVRHSLQSALVKSKIEATNMKRYGKSRAIQTQACKDKMKATNIKKQGVEYNIHLLKNKAKLRQGLINKFGGPSSFLSQQVRDKAMKTMNEKYNMKDLQAKAEATNLVRYGARNAMQNAEVSERSMKNAKATKDYMLPSGKNIKLQGFEPGALDLLLNFYDEESILNKRTDMPEIYYLTDDGKYSKYYPDFYLPNDNLIVEVKSWYTYKNNFRNTDMKRKACEYLGFEYLLIMFNKKNELIKFI